MRRRGSECIATPLDTHISVWDDNPFPPQRKCPSQRVECYSGGRSAGVLSKTCHIDSSPRTSLCLWQFESEGPASDFLRGRQKRKMGEVGRKAPTARISFRCPFQFDCRTPASICDPVFLEDSYVGLPAVEGEEGTRIPRRAIIQPQSFRGWGEDGGMDTSPARKN